MATKALRAIDEKGLMRLPTLESCAALVLMEKLLCCKFICSSLLIYAITLTHTVGGEWVLTGSNFDRRSGAALLSAAVEHIRVLSETKSFGDENTLVDDGNVFWTVWQRDTQSSVLGGSRPRLWNEDIVSTSILSSLCDGVQPLYFGLTRFIR